MSKKSDFGHYTRFEVIDHGGRRIVFYGNVQSSIQDDGKTLKVFVDATLPQLKLTAQEEIERDKQSLLARNQTVIT